MKRLATFALVVLFGNPATAQQPSQRQPAAQRQSIELELLEMEQDVDKTILREALLIQGRQGLKLAPDSRPEKDRADEEAVALAKFIENKKEAIIARSAELAKTRVASRRAATTFMPAGQPSNTDKQALIEKIEKAQIDTQLLQAQLNLLQEPMSLAINALAAAEHAASNDETQRPKAEEARKAYDKIKSRYAERSKRLQIEQQELQSMQQMGGMGSFGGGFR